MPQRLYSILKTCQRAVGLPRNTPKNIKFASNSVYTTSSQRPYSVHTMFPHCLTRCANANLRHLFWACSKQTPPHGILGNCTAHTSAICNFLERHSGVTGVLGTTHRVCFVHWPYIPLGALTLCSVNVYTQHTTLICCTLEMMEF